MNLETVRKEAQQNANELGVAYVVVKIAGVGYQFMTQESFDAMDEDSKAKHKVIEEITPQKTEA